MSSSGFRSKSVHEPRASEDGIRVCVMRRIKDHFDLDLWLPALAPSNELLNEYNEGKINWEQYLPRFQAEVLNNPDKVKYFMMLKRLGEESVVTLLCHESDDEFCHRRLLLEHLQTLD